MAVRTATAPKTPQKLQRELEDLQLVLKARNGSNPARDELMRRLSGRWICTVAPDHVYHATARPPRVEGVCDVDGAPLYQRDDDKPATIAARLEQQLPPMFEVVDYYADRGVLSTVDGEQPVADVTDALLRAFAQPAR